MENTINTIGTIATISIKNNNVVEIEARTEPKMNKRGNDLYGRVTKHTAYSGISFKSYKTMVNEQRAAQGLPCDFEPQESAYERVNDAIVRKGEQLYIQFNYVPSTARIKSIWMVDNRPATKEEVAYIQAFLPTKSGSNRQELPQQQAVECRRIKLENVTAISIDGVTTTLQEWRA